jgi:hypothetical protein
VPNGEIALGGLVTGFPEVRDSRRTGTAPAGFPRIYPIFVRSWGLPAFTTLSRPLSHSVSSRRGDTIGTETFWSCSSHVKILEEAGLVDKVDERRVRGIMEGLYQARARSYWLSPRIVGRIGGPARTRDQMSLGFLLTLAEEIQLDVARLAERPGEEVPSLGLSAHIELRDPSARAAFLSEVRETFKGLARKYGQGAGARSPSFKISLVCYPKSGKAREWQE